jgi:transposase InsO family protein
MRRAIQANQESLVKAAKRFNVNWKTIDKWRKRDFVNDARMGPKVVKSTVLSEAEEAMIVAFRQKTQLPLDDVLYTLQDMIPHLTRSSFHRCFVRHGVNRRSKAVSKKPVKKKFKHYPIGYFHLDIAEVRTAEGRLYLFVAIDRTSKFSYAELHKTASRAVACEFLKQLIAAVPYKIHTVLTDNGIQFTHRPQDKWDFETLFDRLCQAQAIEHRLTQVKHPWTNGQVERMNRTLKEATVKQFYYDSSDQLKQHLYAFLMVYNFSKRLKSLRGLSPYEFVCRSFESCPECFSINPCQFTTG